MPFECPCGVTVVLILLKDINLLSQARFDFNICSNFSYYNYLVGIRKQ